MTQLQLVSHKLCPYVQRAVISLTEKGVPFERIDIDLSNKPDWFLGISPLGKTPVLLVDGQPIFESAVILEYLEETQASPLHPSDPLERAQHRAWIEFGSAILSDIAGFYSAADVTTFAVKTEALKQKFERLESELGDGPFFAVEQFSLVDAVFGPVFRYFESFDQIGNFGILASKPKVTVWRKALRDRAAVKDAVSKDYPDLLWQFLERRQSHITSLMGAQLS
ncbi:MAG: glutathione S-transferase family protein [Geminicoccaceae bacterium]